MNVRKQFAMEQLRYNAASELPIHLILTKDRSGEDCYFLLRASHIQYRKLMADKGKPTDINDYGEILFSGFGKPNLQARQRIRHEFGVDIPDNL